MSGPLARRKHAHFTTPKQPSSRTRRTGTGTGTGTSANSNDPTTALPPPLQHRQNPSHQPKQSTGLATTPLLSPIPPSIHFHPRIKQPSSTSQSRTAECQPRLPPHDGSQTTREMQNQPIQCKCAAQRGGDNAKTRHDLCSSRGCTGRKEQSNSKSKSQDEERVEVKPPKQERKNNLFPSPPPIHHRQPVPSQNAPSHVCKTHKVRNTCMHRPIQPAIHPSIHPYIQWFRHQYRKASELPSEGRIQSCVCVSVKAKSRIHPVKKPSVVKKTMPEKKKRASSRHERSVRWLLLLRVVAVVSRL